MEIIVLGSGTMTSLPDRNPAGYLLLENASALLLDVGPGIIRQLSVLPFPLTRISTILITHFHPDHYADLVPLLMARYLVQKEINRQLTIVGPFGLKERFESQARWEGRWLNDHLPRLIEWNGTPFSTDGWLIRAQKTEHTPNSVAYRLERNGRAVFFSGDTDWQDELIPLAAGTDVAFFECSLPENLKQKGHLTPKETGTLAQKAGVKRLMVTHIYPENDTPDLRERVAAYFSGPLTIARDFLRLQI